MRNETELIRIIEKAIKNNDRDSLDDAFNSIYNKYNKLVKYISYGIVKRNEVAEDITQDTFIIFFNTLTKRKIRNIKYYLTTTAKNLSINYLKSVNKRLVYDNELIDSFIAEDSGTELKDNLEEIRKVLSAEEVEIIIFYLVYNFTFREIAEEKNVSVNSISSKYRRAIIKLKKNL